MEAEQRAASQVPKRYRRLRIILLICIAAGLAGGIYWWWNRREPLPPTRIFQGVTYRCDRLSETPESHGLVHIVEVDLTAPGIELFITPVDPAARAKGFDYALKYGGSALKENNLAVAVNGGTFSDEAGRLALPGEFVRSSETIVAGGVLQTSNRNSFLLWFENDLTPHLCRTRPAPPDVLSKAKWAIGGDRVIIESGKPRPGTQHNPDRKTMLAINAERKVLWIAVFDRASNWVAAETLAPLGAQEGIMLDGGTSTTMVIDESAKGVRGGTVMGNWRPVANQFGIRAQP